MINFFYTIVVLFSFFTLNAKGEGLMIPIAIINCEPIPTFKSSTDFTEEEITEEKIKKQKEYLIQKSTEYNINKSTASFIETFNFNENVVKRERTQPERTLTFEEYFTKTMPFYKILDGKKFMLDNWEALEKVEKKYKVDKEAIVALMLIETYLGKILGTYNIMDSLFTLTLTSHRKPFWERELLTLLEVVSKQNSMYNRETKGSWAGAVGMVQFMPSSFAKFGVDGDGDGKIDIISSKIDAFASAANYLKLSGWEYKKPYLKDYNNSLTEEEICNFSGRSFEDGILVMPDKKQDSKSFIAYNNYIVVLKWNRSLLFSTTVGLVFNELKKLSSQI